MKTRLFFLIYLAFLISCSREKTGKEAEVQPRKSRASLEQDILATGDTNSYLQLFNYHMDGHMEDAFYYSLFMANKYNYSVACMDVYLSLWGRGKRLLW